ncbi:UNVERIFIED_CONTAM: hypothetical protein PYX00_010005 [Menopon gallinae]|uniref:EF-hand domain-containing protein n=1 Tax=Menopon gallinae TaxID=328185 RepID=A0AAW2HDB9_9NEOP
MSSFFYDETIGSLETIRFLNRCMKLTNDLKNRTHFTLQELQNILIVHYKLTKHGGPINYRRFREIAHRLFDITGDEHYDKIYYRFDQHRGMQVSLESWATCLSVLLRGTMEEKIDYCWKVYDQYNLGYLTRELMFQYMRKSIIKASAGEDSDEVVKDLVDVILKKMDIDRDGKLSYEDYKTSVSKNPMLLEALGQVLPPRTFVLSFLTTLTSKYGQL